MTTIISSKLDKGSNKSSFTFVFVANNDNKGVIEINEPLLNTLESAKVRAVAELIDNGLNKETITFKTYRNDIKIGDTVKVYGISYKVIGKDIVIDDKSNIITIKAIKY